MHFEYNFQFASSIKRRKLKFRINFLNSIQLNYLTNEILCRGRKKVLVW